MKKYFLFIFVFVLLMISGICSGSALTNSIEAPYYENYRYIEPTESFANGTNKPVIFTIGGTYYFCSHLHLTEPWGKTCTKAGFSDTDHSKGKWSINMAAAIGKLVQTVSANKSDENLYYFEIATNQFIKDKGEGDNDNNTAKGGPTATYNNFYNILNTEYNRVKTERTTSPSPTITMSAFTYSNNNYVSNVTVSGCSNCNVTTSKGTLSHTSGSNGNGSYKLTVSANSVNPGSKVSVTVTANDTKTITAKLARNYYCGEDVQTITPLAAEDYSDTKTGSSTKSVDLNRTQLIFKKTNVKTGEVVPGGSFIVTKDDVEIDEVTSGTKTYTDIAYGKYCVEEKEAPIGYTNMKEKKCMTLAANSLNQSITISNDLTSIKIKKIDSTTKKALEGAKLVIVDEDDNVVSTINDEECSWTSEDDYVTFMGLPVGTYYIKELEAPEGYTLIDNPVEFTIEEDGNVVTSKEENLSDDSIIVVENKLTKVDISKQDATTGKELPGAHLQILDEDDNVVKEWISTDTPHRVEGLKAGRYKLKETIAPSGYQKTETTVEFVIYSDGKTEQVVMKNEPIKVYVPSTAKDVSMMLSIGGITFVMIAGILFLYKEGIFKLSRNRK